MLRSKNGVHENSMLYHPYLAVLGFMDMACRWVTIWRGRHNRKVYGESKTFFDQSRARIISVVYGYGCGYGRPVQTI
jgi:hypothetical protein